MSEPRILYAIVPILYDSKSSSNEETGCHSFCERGGGTQAFSVTEAWPFGGYVVYMGLPLRAPSFNFFCGSFFFDVTVIAASLAERFGPFPLPQHARDIYGSQVASRKLRDANSQLC